MQTLTNEAYPLREQAKKAYLLQQQEDQRKQAAKLKRDRRAVAAVFKKVLGFSVELEEPYQPVIIDGLEFRAVSYHDDVLFARVPGDAQETSVSDLVDVYEAFYNKETFTNV